MGKEPLSLPNCTKQNGEGWFLSTEHKLIRVTSEEGTSDEKLPRSDWPMGMSVGRFLGQ